MSGRPRLRPALSGHLCQIRAKVSGPRFDHPCPGDPCPGVRDTRRRSVHMRCVCEPYGDGQAAFGACAGGEGGVVSLGDGVDDGETEAVAVAAAVTIGRPRWHRVPLQGDAITSKPWDVARIALPLLAYFALMWAGSPSAAWRACRTSAPRPWPSPRLATTLNSPSRSPSPPSASPPARPHRRHPPARRIGRRGHLQLRHQPVRRQTPRPGRSLPRPQTRRTPRRHRHHQRRRAGRLGTRSG
jgi:hypothetical protein